MLKSTVSSIASPLRHICNLSISSSLVPLDWKFSLTVPIPKSSPPSNLPNLYQPIFLLSLTSKLLEKHIHQILLNHCLSHGLISHYQFEFLPHCSTSSASFIPPIVFFLYSNLTPLSVVFFSTSVRLLTPSPISPYSTSLSLCLSPQILNWLHSYLLTHYQRVVINAISGCNLV